MVHHCVILDSAWEVPPFDTCALKPRFPAFQVREWFLSTFHISHDHDRV